MSDIFFFHLSAFALQLAYSRKYRVINLIWIHSLNPWQTEVTAGILMVAKCHLWRVAVRLRRVTSSHTRLQDLGSRLIGTHGCTTPRDLHTKMDGYLHRLCFFWVSVRVCVVVGVDASVCICICAFFFSIANTVSSLVTNSDIEGTFV